ncbi:hypothetical protein [Kitasatospora sp. A2-31]|uniref:hypothetical protein n=1 Tax=Kitasatospora sp. A2-31 TaxID=2916414 RepID=UPI001EE9337C|nr:hypothetical protein [Kitasatospora sp. A2-31]MCG6493456.1 hypothetical protein [Kitasatospora sp. A2-31]
MRRTTLTLLAAAATLSLAACDPTPTSSSGSSTAAAPPPAGAAPPSAAPAATAPAGPQVKAAALPNFVGMGLQSAQNAAQAAGFYTLTSHDALGRSRNQIDDRNWKVCAQTPAPGEQPTNAKIDMGAVKLDEQCPTQDQGASAPTKAGTVMPDFKGKAVSIVHDTLDKATSISAKDATTQNRMVLVASNWQVCSQDPPAGATLTGQPVTLKAVKFGENCP